MAFGLQLFGACALVIGSGGTNTEHVIIPVIGSRKLLVNSSVPVYDPFSQLDSEAVGSNDTQKRSATVFSMAISQRTISCLIFWRKSLKTGLDEFIPVKTPNDSFNCGIRRRGDDDERSFDEDEIPLLDVPRCEHPEAHVGCGQNLVGVFVWLQHGQREFGCGKDGLYGCAATENAFSAFVSERRCVSAVRTNGSQHADFFGILDGGVGVIVHERYVLDGFGEFGIACGRRSTRYGETCR